MSALGVYHLCDYTLVLSLLSAFLTFMSEIRNTPLCFSATILTPGMFRLPTRFSGFAGFDDSGIEERTKQAISPAVRLSIAVSLGLSKLRGGFPIIEGHPTVGWLR
jgi:hypothetical protein